MIKIRFSKYILFSLTILACGSIFAQSSKITVDKNLIYRQEHTPELVDNYNYNSFYTFNKDIYNLKNFQVSHASDKIIDFKVNPAGYSFAVLTGKGKNYSLTIYSSTENKKELARVQNLNSPTALAYSPDSKYIYLSNNNYITQYNSKNLERGNQFQIKPNPFRIKVDPNNQFLICIYPNSVDIYNLETGLLRNSLPYTQTITDAEFTPNSEGLCVVTETGILDVYNTADFRRKSSHVDLGPAKGLSVHPEGKYAAISTSENRVQFVNFLDDFDRPYLTDPTGPHNFLRFLSDKDKNIYVAYDADNSIVYKRISGFAPNYSQLLRDQVNERMIEWSKMRPMETEEEYRLRMSPENVERQRRLFANEIATSLAGDLINRGTVTLGKYNPQTGLLAVNIGSLPTIYLQVPEADMPTFGSGDNLKFSNEVFSITPNDTFEVIYVEVFNPTNNKHYTFNNLEGQDLSYLATDDSFVSLDLIMKSNKEDVMLKDIKDKIVQDAMSKNLISDHTRINVDTRIESVVNADGNRINNYIVSFNYNVDGGYSNKEDFPSGKYKINESNAAQSMMEIVKQAFDTDFADYLAPGKKLIVEITGSADGSPVTHAISYDGIYGSFDNEPIKINGELTTVTVSPQTNIRSNEELAFMRAQAVKNDLEKKLSKIEGMNTDYRYNVELSKEKGGQYRRISLVLIFVDAL